MNQKNFNICTIKLSPETNNEFLEKYSSEIYGISNLNTPIPTVIKYKHVFDESEKLQKRINIIKRITPMDILRKNLQFRPIPKQKHIIVIDESVHRLDLKKNNKSSVPKEKKRCFSLQHILAGVNLNNDSQNLDEMNQSNAMQVTYRSKKISVPCLTSRFWNKKSENRLCEIDRYLLSNRSSKTNSIKKYPKNRSPQTEIRKSLSSFFNRPESDGNYKLQVKIENLCSNARKTGDVFRSVLKDNASEVMIQTYDTRRKDPNLSEKIFEKINNSKQIDPQPENKIQNIQSELKIRNIRNKNNHPLLNISLHDKIHTPIQNFTIKRKNFLEGFKEGLDQNTLVASKNLQLLPSPANEFRDQEIKTRNDTVELCKGILRPMNPPRNPLFDPPTLKHYRFTSKYLASDEIKQKYARIRNKLRHCLYYFKLLKLTIHDVLENPDIFSQKPFQKPGSYELIKAAKFGDYQEVIDLIVNHSRFIVYDFDNLNRTALHIASKRGYLNIVKILIENGADVNAIDMIGRTPLYFAIKYERIDIFNYLLYSRCDPWSIEDMDYKELCKNNEPMKRSLKKARRLNMLMMMKKPHQREMFWEIERKSILYDF